MIRRLKKFVKKNLYRIKVPVHLDRETIVINPNSWRSFEKGQFDFGHYCVKECLVEEISPSDYHHIVAIVGNVRHDLLKKLGNLQWLQIPSHGYNHYDDASLYTNADIVVTNVKDVFSYPIAQFCIAAYYFANTYGLRKLVSAISANDTFRDVRDTTVVIYGLGNIGSRVAELCKKQGWVVYGIKRNVTTPGLSYVDGVYSFADAAGILGKADYVINVLPETEETIGIFDYDFFARLKQSCCFCNVGRGSAVNDEDLNNAIRAGMLKGGVILDAANHYRYANQVIHTGHSSSALDSNDDKFDKYFASQLRAFLKNEACTNQIVLK